MRCKKHLPDLTSTVGVCATCLRERLEPLAEDQAQAQSPHPATVQPDPIPPPVNLPPYVTRRKTDSDRRQENFFHSTPQVSTGFTTACDGGAAAVSSKRRNGRFWILSSLFRARSNKTDDDSSRDSYEPSSSSAAASPPLSSWFSTVLPARRQTDRRRCRQPDLGASATQAENNPDISPPGCSSESSPQRRHQTPTVARRSRFCPAGKSLASIAFCLSPLVRASPNQKLGLGGPQHISSAVSYCANRSRKLADFGRVSHIR